MIVKCTECGKEISGTVKTCIHCGFKVKKMKVVNETSNKNKTLILSGVFLTVLVGMMFVGIFTNTPEKQRTRQAKTEVKRFLRGQPEGSSYKPLAWGQVQYQDFSAGTGYKSLLSGVTGKPPSDYSITHRYKMRTQYGFYMTEEIRIFFTDNTCTKYAGYEYLDKEDYNRYLMRETGLRKVLKY